MTEIYSRQIPSNLTADFNAAHSIYPEILIALGVPEKDAMRNATQVTQNVKKDVNAFKADARHSEQLLQEAREKMNHFVRVMDILTK